MASAFETTDQHLKWARGRQRIYGGRTADYLELIQKQAGKCALSGIALIFDPAQGGGSVKGGPGCHPLYAALDHCCPKSSKADLQIICYALNDVKGHLPLDCFLDLVRTPSWRRLMAAWRKQHRKNQNDREAFQKLIFQDS